MTSSAERSSSIFASPSTGRRILNKFASPFGSKTRSISEFTVKAHDPHKLYSPGENVEGAVIVRVVKPIRLTHISVCLHGFVQVNKTPGSPPESVRGYGNRVGRSQGKKSGEYFGNGFASLFEDESVLCGEGRLAEGSYRFDFEVSFPKDIDLPSSIEFERGTICYMVTATLTRPTTINPTISHDQRLYLCERIDIANLLPPKSRTITLEPVPRKSKARVHSKRLPAESRSQARTGSSLISARTQESSPSSVQNTVSGQNVVRTPSISEASVTSGISSSVGRASASGSAYQLRGTSDSVNGLPISSSSQDKTITATVESLKGGCLRGDSIPIRISVSHTKHIKSMNGVIVTLYRLARVDLHPALPLGPMSDGQKRKYEDYYPKSLTGLGGLSLSDAGSSHVFRKDLAQTVVPMIVDPQTLKADITAKVKVPEDAFPTINTVPGSMISFRYYIEVVLDIQGKLARNDKFFLQKIGTYGANFDSLQETNGIMGGENASLQVLQGPGILDTAPIRRDKSVVTSMFEVVVGTLDSERKKGKARARTPPEDENVIDTSCLEQGVTSIHQGTTRSNQNPNLYAHPEHYPYPDWYEWDPNAPHDWSDYPAGYYENDYDGSYGYENGDYYDDYNDAPQFLPPPPMETEEDLPEKERLRRAEARLMPSQPPIHAQDSVSHEAEGPSAPVLLSEIPLVPSMELVASEASSHYPRTNGHAGGSTLPYGEGSSRQQGPMPNFEPEPTIASRTDDKQELQRRHLQLNASAPLQVISPDQSTGNAEISVPILEESSGNLLSNDDINHRVEHLPRYTR